MKIDYFAICAHPDDLEVCAGGIFLQAKRDGLRTGAVVLTDGGASGRADSHNRKKEALAGAEALGLDYFSQLDFPDAALEYSQIVIEALIPHLRACSPRVLFTLHPEDCHPDHVAASRVAEAAAFVAGLPKHSQDGSDWHYEALFYFAADPRTVRQRPDILVNVDSVIEEKLKACAAHVSQEVMPYAIGLSRSLGAMAGCEHAEGLYLRRALVLQSIQGLFGASASL